MAQFIPLILTVAAGTAAAIQQRNAGIAVSNEAKLEAKKEGDAARGREIERRRDLIRAISSQNARAGALGIATTGSVGAIARADIRDAQNDLLTDSVNTQTRQSILRSQARNARAQGNLGAVTSLLDTGAKAYKQLPGKKKI